jgi:hypothetical protein
MGKSYKLLARTNGTNPNQPVEVTSLSVSATDIFKAVDAGAAEIEIAHPVPSGQETDFNEVYSAVRVPARGGTPDIVLAEDPPPVRLVVDTSDSSVTTLGFKVSPWDNTTLEVAVGTPVTFVLTDIGTASSVVLTNLAAEVLATFTAEGQAALVIATADNGSAGFFTVKVAGT